MTGLKAVSPEEVDEILESGMTKPILDEFLGSKVFMAELVTELSWRKMYTALNGYIRNHAMPVRVILRKGKIYLMRRDVDKNGEVIEDWKDQLLPGNGDVDEAESSDTSS